MFINFILCVGRDGSSSGDKHVTERVVWALICLAALIFSIWILFKKVCFLYPETLKSSVFIFVQSNKNYRMYIENEIKKTKYENFQSFNDYLWSKVYSLKAWGNVIIQMKWNNYWNSTVLKAFRFQTKTKKHNFLSQMSHWRHNMVLNFESVVSN